jgi:hypothetical protein
MSEHEAQTPRSRRFYSAEKVRQGVIVLRKRWQRVVFVVGLVGAVLLALFVSVRGGH